MQKATLKLSNLGLAALLISLSSTPLCKAEDLYLSPDQQRPSATTSTSSMSTPIASSVVMTTVGTPFSSIITKHSDNITLITGHPVLTNDGQLLPAGTRLIAKMNVVEASHPKQVSLTIHKGVLPSGQKIAVQGQIDTTNGTLDHKAAESSSTLLLRSGSHNFNSLKNKMRERLGADIAVYNQMLGVNQGNTVQYMSDEFLVDYHKQDVLIGAGDQLRIKLGTSNNTNSNQNFFKP